MNYLIHTSVEQMVREAEERPDFEGLIEQNKDYQWYIGGMMRRCWEKWTRGESSFSGSTAEVVSAYRGEHYYEAQKMADTMCSVASDDFMKKRFTFKNKQLFGQRVDIPRYLSGDQRCWFATRKIRRLDQAVRVYAPIGGLGCVSEEMMRVCGALACSVVEALEAEGINVELWAAYHIQDFFDYNGNSTDPDHRKICGMVKIKDSSEYSDLGLISYVTGNAKFYRNIVFKSRARYAYDMFIADKRIAQCNGNYHSSDFDMKWVLPDGEYNKENTIVIPRIYDIATAKAWFNEKFNNENNRGE